jgi:hypothetical protein
MGGIGLIDIDSFCSLSNREFMDLGRRNSHVKALKSQGLQNAPM